MLENFVPSSGGGPDAGEPGSLFHERVMRYLDDALDADGVAELSRELQSSESKRNAFALICFGESLAWEALLKPDGLSEPPAVGIETDGSNGAGESGAWGAGLSDAMVLPAIHSEPEPEEPYSPPAQELPELPAGWGRRWRVAAVVGGLVVAGGLLLLLERPGDAAQIASATAVRWDGGASFEPGTVLKTGTELSIASGCADLRFRDGADLIAEGPARFTLLSKTSISLASGKVVVRMPPGGSGFSVRTASGTITDLGTEFGIRVAPPGGAGGTEVHVFQGHVEVAPTSQSGGVASVVKAGDAARVEGRRVKIDFGGASPQAFIRSIEPLSSLDVVDLFCGGDGSTHRRGNEIDAGTGNSGLLTAVLNTTGDDRYHPVPALPVVDGCFIPNGASGPVQIDSAGHTFDFPRTNGITYARVVAGGHVPVPAGADEISTVLAGVDYASPGRGLLLVHPNAGLTLDLPAIRRLHPGSRLTRFVCVLGNSHPRSRRSKNDAYIVADGVVRFEQRKFTADDGVFQVDIPIQDSDHFLTIATTDGGDGTGSDDVMLGDPSFTLAPVAP